MKSSDRLKLSSRLRSQESVALRKTAPTRPRTEILTFYRAAEGDSDTKIAMR